MEKSNLDSYFILYSKDKVTLDKIIKNKINKLENTFYSKSVETRIS